MSSSAGKSAIEAPSEKCLRVPCYCEENVWRLAYRKIYHDNNNNNNSRFHVVFISNPEAVVPMFQQLAGSDHGGKAVFWDYHVILFETVTSPHTTGSAATSNNSRTVVWDVDSYQPFPCPLETYIEAVFPNHVYWHKKYAPYFRVVDASVYLQYFSSDRSHMYNPDSNEWKSTPPSYDCINAPNHNDNSMKVGNNRITITNPGNTLEHYMTISNNDIVDAQQADFEDSTSNRFGHIFSLPQLRHRFYPTG